MLPEVGDPINDERSKLVDMLAEAEGLEKQAATLRATVQERRTALLSKVMKLWKPHEIEQAKARFNKKNSVATATPAPATIAAPAERVAVSFDSYNERRYSLPWIARVDTWPVGKRPNLTFGRYTSKPGDAGDAEILARPGDVVKWGKKDTRNGNDTLSLIGVVQKDYSISECTELEARKAFLGGSQ